MIALRLGAVGVAIALTFAVFAIWPGLDPWAAGLFFDPVAGFSADRGLPEAFRLAVWRLSEAVLTAAVLSLLLGLWVQGEVLGIPRRVWSFVTLLYLLGPGLLVDVILKPGWGRARPADVTAFGGTLPFTPPHVISGACTRNCSFTAGEVAGAVALSLSLWIVFSPRLSRRWRSGLAAVLVLVPLLIALQRIAAGRHFLSDSILSALFVLAVALLLHRVLFRRRPT